ncbi:MAG: substrate-binding domain-containing protein [Planctomycetes bacterium]|nr:substrate-binding domain-containing protein [Planctomycetota bacterium]
MRIARWICVFAAAGAVLAAGCKGQGEGEKAGGGKMLLAFVTNNTSDFWTIARAGCNKAVAELPNVQLEFRLPDGTAADQKRIMDDLLTKGAAGIAISPVDPANQTLTLNEVAKRTLLLTQDSDAPTSDRACYIGTDNVAAGRQAGELIKQALPDGGKIVVFVGSLDAQNAKDRFAGIKEVIQGAKIDILDARTDDTDRVRAKANVLDAIVRYSDVACLVGLWSYNGPAILNAVKESGKVGKVKIVCFDEEDETLQGVRDGAIFATVVQQPYEFGYQAIKIMARVAGGDKSLIPASKQIIVPTLAITKDKVDEFAARLKVLRGR